MRLITKNTATSVANLLDTVRGKYSGNEAIYDGRRRMNYKELDDESNAIAHELTQLGIKKGDHVAACLPNWHEFVVIVFAIAKIGATLVPLNTSLKLSEIEYVLRASKVKVAFIANEIDGNILWDHFYEVFRNKGYLKHLITVRFEHEFAKSYKHLLLTGLGQSFAKVETSPEDVFLIMFTSGTTGKPKGTMLTHDNLVRLCDIVMTFLKCTDLDVVLGHLPFSHLFGMHTCLLCPISVGARIVLLEKFQPEKVFQLIEKEKITVHHGVPSMFILELNHPSRKTYDLTSLRIGITAGAPIPAEIITRIRNELHCEVLASYGMTESSTTLTCARLEDSDRIRSETVGKAMPEVELRIINRNTRKELQVGEIGEVVARSPGIMKGYFEMPLETKEVLAEDGWFSTGDLGTIDAEGNLNIVGRVKDLIIRGGYNIFPKEIEDHFYRHENVLEVAIIGLPDTVLGEITCAVITIKNNHSTAAINLKNYIQDRVAEYKVPDKIIIVTDMPRSVSGKINKKLLKEQMEHILANELR